MTPSTPRRRRAFLLVETAMAGFLVVAAMTLIVGLLSWIAAERRSADRRSWAAQEAANAMEKIAALPFDRLTRESAGGLARLSGPARDVLPDARISVEVRDEEDLPLRRIDLEVRWTGRSGRDEAPVRLSSWVSRKDGHR